MPAVPIGDLRTRYNWLNWTSSFCAMTPDPAPTIRHPSIGPGRSLLLLLTLSSAYVHGQVGPPAAAPPDTAPMEAPLIHPEAVAIRNVLDSREHPRLKWPAIADVREALDAFYRSRGDQPVWIGAQALLSQVPAILASLADAEAQGLNPADYDAGPLAQWLPRVAETADPAERALFDTALTVSVMRYANSLHRGRVSPGAVGFRLDPGPDTSVEVLAALQQLAAGAEPAVVFQSLEPRSVLYGQLKAGLRALRTAPQSTVDRRLTLPSKLTPGDRNTEVPKLRAVLTASGEALAEPTAPENRDLYDPVLVEAVKRFQARHGLEPDGVVGRGTVERLQLTDEDRITQIRLAMERQRWLPVQPAGRHLLVNVPAFQLFGFADGSGSRSPDFAMKVIVGQAIDGRQTPLFAAEMTYLVFRPHWNLPYKIATKEMLPGAMRNPGYLSRHNIEIVSGYGGNAAVYAPTRQNLQRVSSGALKLRQKPGPRNALGLVKFAFPNDDSVYLHSTPNPGLFTRARRDFSHGCIRVADPVALAEWVLRNDAAWNRERIVQAMHGDKPRTVTLSPTLPVTIFYSTVWADESGALIFYPDLYGHDATLRARLEEGFSPVPTGPAHSVGQPGFSKTNS